MEKLAFIAEFAPFMAIGCVAIAMGWVANTWIRVKNGYPLDGQWGQALYPKKDQESVERIKLLSQENAQLRAEIGSIKDRLANVERIVTDEGVRLSHEIEALRTPAPLKLVKEGPEQ